jgi:hypothetical protein
MPVATDVPALIPLSLLEALRNLDTPQDDGLHEVVTEVVVKRLGLSGTVAAQIERYEDDMGRNAGVSREEALGVFRLVGRRPDAALALADAGRRAARYAADGAGAGTKTMMRVTPGSLSQKLGFGAAARVARRRFGAELRGSGRSVEARIEHPLSVEAIPGGEGCAFYGSLFAELLRVLAGKEGAMTHDRCRSRGDSHCVWHFAEAEGY